MSALTGAGPGAYRGGMTDSQNHDELLVTADADASDEDTDVLPGLLPGSERTPVGADESEPTIPNDPGLRVDERPPQNPDAVDSAAAGHEEDRRANTVDGALSPGSTATGSPTGRDLD